MAVDSRSQQNLAVLVGNGLSIAFNPRLNLAEITQEMIAQIEAATDNGDKVVHAMKVIAERAVEDGAVTDDDFEKLVGAFDSQAFTLEELSTLAGLVAANDDSLKAAIDEVSSFSQRVRDMGVSYVLRVIMDRSRADWIEHLEMHSLVLAILDAFDGEIYFGNLNYDTLLLSALMALGASMADLGRGYPPLTIKVTDREDAEAPARTYSAWPLRREDDLPINRRVKLLHLHGSLTYWHDSTDEQHIKLPIDVLRDHDLWSGLREGNPKWRPSVVLANQRDKARHVLKHPFKLAYEIFQKGLAKAEHWIIIGYSFRDACVNDILREEFMRASTKPRVLVCTYGDELTDSEVERAFGWGAAEGDSREWLLINRDGARGLKDSFEWALFNW